MFDCKRIIRAEKLHCEKRTLPNDRKSTKSYSNDIEYHEAKSMPCMLKYCPGVPIFTPFCSMFACFSDN